MSTPEVRLSPDETQIAVRFNKQPFWSVQAERAELSGVADGLVSDWTPLAPASTEDRVDCPWCGKPGRKLTASGAIRRHGKPVFPPQDCEGSGREPSEFGGAA